MSLFEGLANSVGLGAQGASNNMYGNAQNMTATQYNNALLGQQKAASALSNYPQGVLQGGKVFDPNEHEAFQIPLSQLVTMWRLKYSDRWIKPTEEFPRFDGEFYSVAFDRMSAMHMFEAYQGWVRLKEDA